MRYLLTTTLSLLSFFAFAQRIVEIVPHLGLQYYGISKLKSPQPKPSDFEASAPELTYCAALDIKWVTPKITHIVTVQNLALGYGFRYSNMFSDRGVVPSFLFGRSSAAIRITYLGYAAEKELNRRFKFIAKSRMAFLGSVGAGVSFNRSQQHYVDALFDYIGWTFNNGTSFSQDETWATAKGVGYILSGRLGLQFYNKRSKNFLVLQAYWHQGLNRMVDLQINYKYWYPAYPQYSRNVDVNMHGRGTSFGLLAGVPIRIINKKQNRPEHKH